MPHAKVRAATPHIVMEEGSGTRKGAPVYEIVRTGLSLDTLPDTPRMNSEIHPPLNVMSHVECVSH